MSDTKEPTREERWKLSKALGDCWDDIDRLYVEEYNAILRMILNPPRVTMREIDNIVGAFLPGNVYLQLLNLLRSRGMVVDEERK
jgi:hypothetical protein